MTQQTAVLPSAARVVRWQPSAGGMKSAGKHPLRSMARGSRDVDPGRLRTSPLSTPGFRG